MGVSIQGGDGTSGHLKRASRCSSARAAPCESSAIACTSTFRRSCCPTTVQPERAAPVADTTATAPPATRAAAPVAPTPAAAPSPRDAYRATMQPAIERFEQLTPFLLSATASPSEPVLKAVGSTLAGIQGLLLSVEVPIESRRTHEALSSAVSAAAHRSESHLQRRSRRAGEAGARPAGAGEIQLVVG